MYIFDRDQYAESRQSGLGGGFVSLWMLANVVGAALGTMIVGWLGDAIALEGAWSIVTLLLAGGITGAIVGLGEGLILRQYFKAGGLLEWIVASTVGYMVTTTLLSMLIDFLTNVSFSPAMEGFWTSIGITAGSMPRICWFYILLALSGAIAGTGLGAAQSFVLKKQVGHGNFWMAANAAAFAVTASLYILRLESDVAVSTINGAVTGFITGIMLTNILKYALPRMGIRLKKKRGPRVADVSEGETQPSPEALLEKSRQGR